MFQARPAWIGLVREDGRTRIAYASAGVEQLGPEVDVPVVELRVEVTPDQIARFSYRQDAGPFRTFGEPAPLRFSWWKGARPALFTFVRPGRPSGAGWIDVDWAHVDHPALNQP